MTYLQKERAWVVSVDMGYGHQRAAYPLSFLSPDKKIVSANNYEGMPESDKAVWDRMKSFYYFISRLKNKGVVGRFAFDLFDELQKIEEYYPLRRKSAPIFQLKKLYDRIAKGWGRHLIQKLASEPIPLITSYFAVAFMAEYWNYPGPIYSIATDADISRIWAPLRPETTRITYFAPTSRVVERLKKYGVPEKNILFAGFPLPLELIGADSEMVRRDFRQRLGRLDAKGDYTKQFAPLIESYLEKELFNKGAPRPPSLAFVVGGAGAQVEIGLTVLKSLSSLIKSGEIIFHFVAGTSSEAEKRFREAAEEAGLASCLGTSLTVLYKETKEDYFTAFTDLLHSVDVLWTKPSELSFYAALGIPIVIAPPIGAQEIQNRKWLLFTGAGLDELSPQFADQWIPDYIRNGRFAEAAMQGFIKMERGGTETIARAVSK